jgi:hypothetical protein
MSDLAIFTMVAVAVAIGLPSAVEATHRDRASLRADDWLFAAIMLVTTVLAFSTMVFK